MVSKNYCNVIKIVRALFEIIASLSRHVHEEPTDDGCASK
jgi:hypothetical protein